MKVWRCAFKGTEYCCGCRTILRAPFGCLHSCPSWEDSNWIHLPAANQLLHGGCSNQVKAAARKV
jgi:hypothetical protein